MRQNYNPSRELLELLQTFRRMVNHCLGIGLTKNVSSVKTLSLLSYKELAHYDGSSYYKLCAISIAAGILASRKKSIKKGIPRKEPLRGKAAARIMLRVQARRRSTPSTHRKSQIQ